MPKQVQQGDHPKAGKKAELAVARSMYEAGITGITIQPQYRLVDHRGDLLLLPKDSNISMVHISVKTSLRTDRALGVFGEAVLLKTAYPGSRVIAVLYNDNGVSGIVKHQKNFQAFGIHHLDGWAVLESQGWLDLMEDLPKENQADWHRQVTTSGGLFTLPPPPLRLF